MDTQQIPCSPAHVVAILKGAIEATPDAHFGSLLGFNAHLADAVRLGLVTVDRTRGVFERGAVAPTVAGLDLYHACGVAGLPAGRANYWQPEHPALRRVAGMRARQAGGGG